MPRMRECLVPIALTVAFIASCNRSGLKTSQDNSQAVHQAISGLVARHHAITDWDKPFDLRPLNVYSTTLEDAVIRHDDRPILLCASVQDVVRESGTYLVYFNSRDVFPEIRFVLRASPEQVGEIERHAAEVRDEWAVIASVSSVRKVKFGLEPKSEAGESDIEVTDPLVFIATGRCVDLLFVGECKPGK